MTWLQTRIAAARKAWDALPAGIRHNLSRAPEPQPRCFGDYAYLGPQDQAEYDCSGCQFFSACSVSHKD